jgi:predicted alpha/beta superfamily hydrolase
MDHSTRRRRLTLAAALIIVAGLVNRPLHSQPVAGPLWTTDSIHSNVLGETRRLRIALPLEYDVREYEAETYPLLIALGDAITFTATVANARALAAGGAPAIPRLVIVNVETPDPSRFYNMTPPVVGSLAGVGGAPAFLRFLSTELRPYIAAHYRTNTVTVLAGHSLTGLFAIWAFGQAPDFLTGAIALSPSLPLFEGSAARQVLDGITARTTHGRLFLLASASEHFAMDSAARSFAAALNAQPAAPRVFDYQRIPDASHGNTALLGMVPGLRFIFRPVSLAGHMIEHLGAEAGIPRLLAVFDSTHDAYIRGTRELGLPQRLPLSFLLAQSRSWADSASAPLLLRVCETLISSYPTLTNGYECAGDAQARLHRIGEAAANYQRAIEATRIAGDNAATGRIARKIADLRIRLDSPHATATVLRRGLTKR